MEVISRNAVQDLADLHWLLDGHFRQLHGERRRLPAAAPVFALEHGLGDDELGHLQQVVRSAVRQGLRAEFRKWWLPFTVYAAESGYSTPAASTGRPSRRPLPAGMPATGT